MSAARTGEEALAVARERLAENRKRLARGGGPEGEAYRRLAEDWRRGNEQSFNDRKWQLPADALVDQPDGLRGDE